MPKRHSNNSKNLFAQLFAFKCNFLFVNNPSILKSIHLSVESKFDHIATKINLTYSIYNLATSKYH